MTRTALATALLSGLLKYAREIGGWIVRAAVEHGAEAVASYMRMRARGVLAARLVRIERRRFTTWRKRRIKWLSGRIARWESAAEWLDANAQQLGEDASKVSEELAPHLRQLPAFAPGERFSPWRAV